MSSKAEVTHEHAAVLADTEACFRSDVIGYDFVLAVATDDWFVGVHDLAYDDVHLFDVLTRAEIKLVTSWPGHVCPFSSAPALVRVRPSAV